MGSEMCIRDSLLTTGVNWLDNTLNIARAEGFTATEKGEALFLETLKVIPAFNNVAQARMMHATGNHADRHGNPILKATMAETVSLALFGIRSDRVDKYWKLRRDWHVNPKFPEGTDREWRDTGRDLANRIILTTRRLNSGDLPNDEYQEKLLGLSSLIKATYGRNEHAMDIIWSGALERLRAAKTANDTTAFDEMAKAFLNDSELRGENGFETINRRLKEVEGKGGDILRRENERVRKATGQ